MKTCVLIIRPERYAQLQDEVSGWVFDRDSEDWIVRLVMTTATSGYALRAELAAQPAFDHLFIIGAVPMIYYLFNLDGHAQRWEPTPWHLVNRDPGIDTHRVAGTDDCNLVYPNTQPYATVGWLSYDGLYGDPVNGKPGLTEDEITEQYRRWFARRRNGFDEIHSFCNDHFGAEAGFGNACAAEFAQFPKSFTRFIPRVVNDDDGEIVKQIPALIDGVFTGGLQWGLLFGFADWQKCRDYPIQAPIWFDYGSFLCDVTVPGPDGRAVDNPISFQWWALVDKPLPTSQGCKVIASIYSWAGMFKFSVFLRGRTIGEAALASYAQIGIPINWLMGDPTLQLDAPTLQRLATNETGDDMSQADLDALTLRFNTFQAQVIAAVPALQQVTTGPPGIVVLSAHYYQVPNPTAFKDVKKQVLDAWAAGRTIFVFSGLKNPDGSWACLNDPSWGPDTRDFAPGVPKRFVMTGTKDGVPFSWDYGQNDVIAAR